MDSTNRIQHLRKSLNMSQEELGKKMFVSRQTVSQWETGQTMPSIESLIKLHEIFGVSVDEILGILPDANEENKTEEMDRTESSSFQYDATEVKKIFSYRTKPLKRNLFFIFLFAAVCFINLCASNTIEVSISFGILFGFFLAYSIIYSKAFFNVKRNLKKAIAKIPNRTYYFAVSEGVLIIKISENGRYISEEHKPIEEIDNITDVDGYYILVISGRSYIIRKSDLKNDSKLLLYMKASDSVKSITPQSAKNWKALSAVTIIASFASILGGLIISTAVSEASGNVSNFTQYMWVMFLFLPIPIFSIILGCILKRKGIKYKKNIVVGIIICCLLCIYGSFAFIFPDTNDAIATVKEEMNIDIPGYTSCSMTTSVYPKSRDTMKNSSRCEFAFSVDNTVEVYNATYGIGSSARL